MYVSIMGSQQSMHEIQPQHNIHNAETATRDQHNNSNKESNNQDISIVVPDTKELRKKFKKTCRSLVIQVYFKGNSIIRALLMALKDKDNKYPKSGVIYRFRCPQINCPKEYIGDSGSSFGERLKEYLSAHALNITTATLRDILPTMNASL